MNPLTETYELLRAQRARANGAKSRGPTTIEGKNKSKMNSLKHGFAAKENVVLSIDDPLAWEAHIEGYRRSFEPTDPVECDLVDQLANLSFRQARLIAMETALLDAQLSAQWDPRQQSGSSSDPYFQLQLAIQTLSLKTSSSQSEASSEDGQLVVPKIHEISSLELIRRYQTSLDRQYRNALLNLRQYRKDFAATRPAQSAEPNEPTPVPEITPPPSAPPRQWASERLGLRATPNSVKHLPSAQMKSSHPRQLRGRVLI